MTSKPVSQTIAICVLTDISRTKGNQTTKFGQLTEYNMKTIFLKSHTENVAEKLFSDSFLKNKIELDSGSIV